MQDNKFSILNKIVNYVWDIPVIIARLEIRQFIILRFGNFYMTVLIDTNRP